MIYLALSLWPELLAAVAIGAVTGYLLERVRTGGTP
ncbi:F0F1-type ATP synthase assembly protein I [Xanthobacter agilis]|jgi:F0F1-type ATP synthase assembly protein I|uniref:F0F1-type ATP synthase assembly protein I n=1 Tax=Xanthobacter agilis TaxID=47492 RepID=A0ABU0LIG5_XANAG|nr:F0F1-type ATP synthase assembly protein I [Xanthobacter agilis]